MLIKNPKTGVKFLSKNGKFRQPGIADLPEDFRERWVSKGGIQRVEIRPKEDLHDPEAVRQFVDQVRQVVPHATGVPVLFLESSDAVVQAFLQAFGYAIVAITLVLFLTMEKKIDVLLVLAAFSFVNETSNWRAITALADFIVLHRRQP